METHFDRSKLVAGFVGLVIAVGVQYYFDESTNLPLIGLGLAAIINSWVLLYGLKTVGSRRSPVGAERTGNRLDILSSLAFRAVFRGRYHSRNIVRPELSPVLT